MKKQILDYTVIISPDTRTGTNEKCFSAYCPTLSLTDEGDTIEEALNSIKELIKFHIRCLITEGQDVPAPDHRESFFGMATIQISGTPKFAAI